MLDVSDLVEREPAVIADLKQLIEAPEVYGCAEIMVVLNNCGKVVLQLF